VAAAVTAVLQATQPEILAVGEAHALRGREHIVSTTQRFEEQLLPVLATYGATELVVELLKPASGCSEAVATVKREQEPIVEKQDTGNQDRFLRLGHAARALGVVPFLLEPDCAEVESIAAAGDDAILRMLELIATKTEQKLRRFWTRNRSAPAPSGRSRLVLAYGGAMHNDIDVVPEKQGFSFGRALSERTAKRYVALDLIVPEYIMDTEVWRALPWYAHFDKENAPPDVTLFTTGPESYVLIFGRTPFAGPE
jgi:hypothetical protein